MNTNVQIAPPRQTLAMVWDSRVSDAIRVRESFLNDPFDLGMHSQTRLNKALALANQHDLQYSTLLSKEVHVPHTILVADRFKRQWERVKSMRIAEWESLPAAFKTSPLPPTDKEIAHSQMRFLTLIDSVTCLDVEEALWAADRMRSDLQKVLKDFKKVWCLGAIEIEVVSLKMMRRIRKEHENTESELRKYDVCETLAKELVGTLFDTDESVFLVHFHGVLTADSTEVFEEFRKTLLRLSRWKQSPRQIEIKRLSEEFKGKRKTVVQNLDHIARYITKGGNDWDGNRICFRYKIGFDKQDSFGEEAYILRGWRKDEDLKREHATNGISDPLSMTGHEIVLLTNVIDGLMKHNNSKTRTGYLVSYDR